MTEGISKERLLEIAKAPINRNNEELQFILCWLITTECIDLDPWLPIDGNTPNEHKDIPQTVCAQEGTVINISDGPNRGKWVSTKEGWAPYTVLQEDPK